MPVAFKYIGDEQAAKNLRRFGQVQLDILANAMSYQGLQQNQRNVKFSDGTIISCKRVMNLDTVTIYVPTQAVPVEKRVITEVTYCWCSRYFSEGTIIEVINPDSKEGEYDQGKYEYYKKNISPTSTSVFTVAIYRPSGVADYTGIRYKVKVCRGIETKIIICGALSIAPHAAGDKVILFCTDLSVKYPKYSTFGQYDFLPFTFEENSCYGKMDSCHSCDVGLRETTEDNELEGTYVITDLSITEVASPDVTDIDVLTYKHVTTTALEKDCVARGFLAPEGIRNNIGAIDFKNNTARIKLLDTGEYVTADVHFNCQSPYAFEDRAKMLMIRHLDVVSLKSWTTNGIESAYYFVLKTTEENIDKYTIMGYLFSSPARCPSRILFLNFVYVKPTELYDNTYELFYTSDVVKETSQLMWDVENDIEIQSNLPTALVVDGMQRLQPMTLDSDHEVNVISGTDAVGGEYVTRYYEAEEVYCTVPLLPQDTYYTRITRLKPTWTGEIHGGTTFYVPLKDKYTREYYSYINNNLITEVYTNINTYGIIPKFFTAWYIDYSEEVYSIPGDETSMPNYQYTVPEILNSSEINNTRTIEYKDSGSTDESTSTQPYYDKDDNVIFNSIYEVFTQYSRKSIASPTPRVDTHTLTDILVEHITPQAYSTCDNSVYLFDIYVTYSTSFSWENLYLPGTEQTSMPTDYVKTYNAYVVGYKQEGITDFSKFKLSECEKFSTGAMINRIKEMAINWVKKSRSTNGYKYFYFSLDGFGIPNN